MEYILILIHIFFLCIQEFIKKDYLSRYEESNSNLYNFFMVLGAIPIYIITAGGRLQFHSPTLFYSFLFALCYAVALIFTMSALSCGSVALTSIFVAFSFILPVGVGLFFFHEPLTTLGKIGLVVLVASVVLIGLPDKRDGEDNEKSKISLKWLIYTLLALVGNGSAVLVVKFHRESYPDAYSSELMIYAMIMVLFVCYALMLHKKVKDGTKMMSLWKPTLVYGGVTGLCNGVVNFLNIKLVEMMDLTEFTLLSKCGSFVFIYIVSRVFFREIMSKKQTIGFALGIVAILLFSV